MNVKASGDSSHLAVTNFRIIEYRGPKRGWLLFDIEFYEYFVPICKFRILDICVSRCEIRD